MTSPVGLEEIGLAARRLSGVALRTPLLRLATPPFDQGPVLLKLESLQRGGAFKLRGAYNFMAQIPPEGKRRGVITYSSGNHGQAVALAARLLGIPATVVVPTTVRPLKEARILSLGVVVIREGTTSLERKLRAEAEAEEGGLTVVPPFDHREIIAGQGTVGLELMEDAPHVIQVLVPVGGGGLIAGVAAAVKGLRPEVRVIGVEPEGAPSMRKALEAGEPVTLERVETVADGLAPVRVGDLTFAVAQALVDEVVLVSDEEILAAMRFLMETVHLVVEPSGAAALVPLLTFKIASDRPTVVIVSGGNINLGEATELLSGEGA